MVIYFRINPWYTIIIKNIVFIKSVTAILLGTASIFSPGIVDGPKKNSPIKKFITDHTTIMFIMRLTGFTGG